MQMQLCDPERRLTQCSELAWLLVGDVREILQDRLDAGALARLRPLLDGLILSLQGIRWAEDSRDPFLESSGQVEELKDHNGQLVEQLESLRDDIEWDFPIDTFAVEVEMDLAEWAELMRDHSRTEHEFMQDAMPLELGGMN